MERTAREDRMATTIIMEAETPTRGVTVPAPADSEDGISVPDPDALDDTDDGDINGVEEEIVDDIDGVLKEDERMSIE